ncbi:MAG: caspase domain-containing protein [Henriciella sp.]|nr:caspase domain-containing protein [Henriciella sp.]
MVTASASEERRIALVIGNGAYQNVPALPNPGNDAADLAEALTLAGFEVIEGRDQTHQEMMQTIREFVELLDGASTGFFFYAGHGLQVDGRNYMLPVDTVLRNEQALQFEAVDMNLVLAQMEREPRVNVIVLDACRDNPFAASLQRSLSGGGLAPMETEAVGTLIVYSTQPGATAADGTGRNSPFTHAFLQHANTPGLELQQMMRRVRASVIDETGNAQVPWDHSSLTGDVFLVPPPEGVDSDAAAIAPLELSDSQIQLQLWNDAKSSQSIAELTAFVEQYPEGPFRSAAEARIRGLELEARQSGDTVADAVSRQVAYGVAIEEPKEPYEFYANARVYELRGDAANAVRMYEKYLTFSPDYVDPHYQYQRYLRATEGRTAAREIYNEMKFDRPDDRTLQYAAALLQSPGQRKVQLEAFLDHHPDFAPALYALSLDYSQRRLGAQTTADKRRERELLDRFIELHERGEYVKYFIDKPAAETEIEDAENRLAALSVMSEEAMETPVSVSFSYTNSGFLITASIADLSYGEVSYRLPGEAFTSLGFFDFQDYRGRLVAKRSFELPIETKETEIEIKYLDSNGIEQGPYSFPFDPEPVLYEAAKSGISGSEHQWIVYQYQEADDDDPAYVSVIFPASYYPCALEKVMYAIDSDLPDTELSLSVCEPLKPNHVDAETVMANWLQIPPETGYLSLQVTYKDGEVSEVKRYPVKW